MKDEVSANTPEALASLKEKITDKIGKIDAATNGDGDGKPGYTCSFLRHNPTGFISLRVFNTTEYPQNLRSFTFIWCYVCLNRCPTMAIRSKEVFFFKTSGNSI